MAKRELISEIDQILIHIQNGHNFLLSGGAGSGKTYTLVQCIRSIIDKYPNKQIACITYTNAAVKEIEERIDHKNLHVSTIHDFLWDCIKNFQKELKEALVYLAKDPVVKKINIENPTVEMFAENGIQYKESLSLSKGIISHDELLIIAEFLFRKHKKLSGIIKDKFNFILVDEYQDTSESVIKIFLEHFKLSQKSNVIGFFGDAMQSIYEDGIGNLDDYKGDSNDLVREVIKIHNRRNPTKIIELANLIRNDGIKQEPQDEKTSALPPNMNMDGTIKQGDRKFIHSSEYNLNNVRQKLGWNFKERDNKGNLICKELNLTHNLIAKQVQFSSLMEIYNDEILAFKNIIVRYLKEHPELLIEAEDTFGEVINKTGLAPKGGAMQDFITKHPELFDEAKSYPYSVFSRIYLGSEILTDDKKQKENEENRKGSKRDNLLKHLFKIQNCIRLYKDGSFNDFLRITDYKINSIEDKGLLKQNIEDLSSIEEKTIGDIIEKAHEYKIVLKEQRLTEFIQKKEYIYKRICKVKYIEFLNLFNYLEGFTPFSTQHKTKGSEFENVLVVLDNGNWNNYKFEYLFDDGSIYQSLIDGKSKTKAKLESYPKIKERTQKIFYVCCTRTKANLAVFYHSPSEQVLKVAKKWFGEENVIGI